MSEQVLTTEWQGVTIAQRHSLISTVDQIARMQRSLEVTTVGILGREGTGKTTLARTIAHLLHMQLSKMPKHTDTSQDQASLDQIAKGYVVRVFEGSTDLSQFREIVEHLPPVNRIIIFDDASFLSKIDIKQVKHDLTKVRHLEGGVDVKTVLIYNYHYSKGLDKYMRDTDFHYLTYVHGEDALNIKDRFGYTAAQKKIITKYLVMWDKFSKSREVTFTLRKDQPDVRKRRIMKSDGSIEVVGGKHKHEVCYRWSDPFRLCMFFDQARSRVAVCPSETWLAGYDRCVICHGASPEDEQEMKIPLQDCVDFGTRYFTEYRRALRHAFRERHGFDPTNHDFASALSYVYEMDKYGHSVDQQISSIDAFKADSLRLPLKNARLIARKKRYAFYNLFGVDVLAQGRKFDKQMIDTVEHMEAKDAESS